MISSLFWKLYLSKFVPSKSYNLFSTCLNVWFISFRLMKSVCFQTFPIWLLHTVYPDFEFEVEILSKIFGLKKGEIKSLKVSLKLCSSASWKKPPPHFNLFFSLSLFSLNKKQTRHLTLSKYILFNIFSGSRRCPPHQCWLQLQVKRIR